MVPVDSLEDPLTLLKLEHASDVFALFDYYGRKVLACHLVQAVVDKVAFITTSEEVEDLFNLLSPLVKDQPDQPQGEVRIWWEGGGGGKVIWRGGLIKKID